MTGLGKFLVVLTALGAIGLAAMSYASWVTGWDFSDNPSKDGAPEGELKSRLANLEKFKKDGVINSMGKGYSDSKQVLVTLEKKRADALKFYNQQYDLVLKNADPKVLALEVDRVKGVPKIDPNTLFPVMKTATNENIIEPGKDRSMGTASAYTTEALARLRADIEKSHQSYITDSKEIEKLTKEMAGLQPRVTQELDKIALLKVELQAMRGNLINIASDLFINSRRLEQLNGRVGELGKTGSAPVKPSN